MAAGDVLPLVATHDTYSVSFTAGAYTCPLFSSTGAVSDKNTP